MRQDTLSTWDATCLLGESYQMVYPILLFLLQEVEWGGCEALERVQRLASRLRGRWIC